MPKPSKSRYWVWCVYPVGNPPAPENWREQLQATGLRCAISPLHDQDTNADEQEKKPHWHVIACWDGPTTYAVAKSVADKLNGCAPQVLGSVRGYYRYLTHKDNPEKFQYDEAEIQHLGGFDPSDYIEWTRSELEKIKRDIFDLIEAADINEYYALLRLLRDSDRFDWFSVAANHTILFRACIDSRRHSRAEAADKAASKAEHERQAARMSDEPF